MEKMRKDDEEYDRQIIRMSGFECQTKQIIMEKEPIINGKAIYTTKGAAREYGRIGCNFYTGCPHECEYCYLKRGITGKALGGNEVRLKKCFKDEKDALYQFRKEVIKHRERLKRTGVFFSFTTDPMIPETIELTMQSLLFLQDAGIPSYILTKNADFIDYELFRTYMMGLTARGLLHFGFTLTGRDDMEPKASLNADRIATMKRLKQGYGCQTWASIEPVIDWKHTAMVVSLSIDCCDHYKIGLRSGVGKDYYDLVTSGFDLQQIVGFITNRRKTVYLKESTRNLLKRFLKPGSYDAFMSYTADMDGQPYQKPKADSDDEE